MQFMRYLTVCFAVLTATLFQPRLAALAESHMPSLDLTPTLIYSTSGNITQTPGVPLVDGGPLLNFSAHVPIVHGVVFSYDHTTNGIFYGTIGRIAAGGQYVKNVLDFRDYFDIFRVDATLGKGLSAELGSSYRHRVCCPADSDPRNPTPTFYHDNYLGISYATPAIAALHGAQFIYNITGHASPHFSDSAAAIKAANAAGHPDARRTEFGITQAATLAVPIDAKHGFSAAGTLTWGAFNYFSNLAIPIYYDVVILSVTKTVTKNVSFTASMDNFVQRPQGYPFERGSGLNGASLNIGMNFHFGP